MKASRGLVWGGFAARSSQESDGHDPRDRGSVVRGGTSGMGVLKFLLPSNDLARRLAGFRKAYITGLDRTPGRLSVEFRNGLMSCFRETSESGRLFVPWPIAGYGSPIVGTATLAERPSPYMLALELARGKLNDVRNQMADWVQMGLAVPARAGSVDGRGAKCVHPGGDVERQSRGLRGRRAGQPGSLAAERAIF